MSIQEKLGQLEALQQNAPGAGIATLKTEIDDWVNQVAAVTGEIGGVTALRGVAEAAKQALDSAAAAIAQLPVDVTSIMQRIQGGN